MSKERPREPSVEDTVATILRYARVQGFNLLCGVCVAPTPKTTRTDVEAGAIYVYEGETAYATPEDELATRNIRVITAQAWERFGVDNVAVVPVPTAQEQMARLALGGTKRPLNELRLVLARKI